MVPRLPVHLLAGIALIAAAGCASQPQRADTDVAQASSPGAVAQPAPAASPAAEASIQTMKKALPPGLLVFAHDQGYNQVVIKGKDYYFCKSEDPMGSMIPVRQCINQSQLDFLRQQVRQQQQQMERRAGETTGGIH